MTYTSILGNMSEPNEKKDINQQTSFDNTKNEQHSTFGKRVYNKVVYTDADGKQCCVFCGYETVAIRCRDCLGD